MLTTFIELHDFKPFFLKRLTFFSLNTIKLYSAAAAAAAAAKSLQSCVTLCDPIDGSPPGSPVHGTLQATH